MDMEKATRSTRIHGVIAGHRSQRRDAWLPNPRARRGGPGTVGPVASAHKSGGRPATGIVYASTFESPHPPSYAGLPAMRLTDYVPASHPRYALETFDKDVFDQNIPPPHMVQASYNDDVRMPEPRCCVKRYPFGVLLPSCENIHSLETGFNGPIHMGAKRHDAPRDFLVNPIVRNDQPKN